jgi:hypothetical protein
MGSCRPTAPARRHQSLFGRGPHPPRASGAQWRKHLRCPCAALRQTAHADLVRRELRGARCQRRCARNRRSTSCFRAPSASRVLYHGAGASTRHLRQPWPHPRTGLHALPCARAVRLPPFPLKTRALNPKPPSLKPQTPTQNHKLNRKPQTANPKPQTPNPKPQTPACGQVRTLCRALVPRNCSVSICSQDRGHSIAHLRRSCRQLFAGWQGARARAGAGVLIANMYMGSEAKGGIGSTFEMGHFAIIAAYARTGAASADAGVDQRGRPLSGVREGGDSGVQVGGRSAEERGEEMVLVMDVWAQACDAYWVPLRKVRMFDGVTLGASLEGGNVCMEDFEFPVGRSSGLCCAQMLSAPASQHLTTTTACIAYACYCGVCDGS